MSLFLPPALDSAAPIVDPADGRITPYFQRFWQNLAFSAGEAADISSKVDKLTSTGWSVPSGVSSKATFGTYPAPTISDPPTQAEMQSLANHVQTLSRHMRALIEALVTAEILGD